MAKRGSDSDYIIREAKVLSVDDNYRGGRIKVRLGGIDANIANDIDLPYCFPLLPKIIHVRPKVGEAVLVILGKNNSGKSNRYYIGPVLSQDYFYLQEMYDISALNMLINRKTKPQQNPDNDQLNKGTLPEPDDIAITGRENTDIILKNNELRLRCGYKENPTGPVKDRLHFNCVDPAYIQLKYKKLKDKNGRDISSAINIVADRINLLSRDSDTIYNLTDNEHLISDDELLNILNTAHPLIYGDQLVEFLKKFIDLFQRHTHPFNMETPVIFGDDVKTLQTDLNAMLSKAVRIN